jgi:hypothetical protein
MRLTRRRVLQPLLVATVAGWLAAGCSFLGDSSRLPTLDGAPPPGVSGRLLCAGGGFPDSIIHGDPADAEIVWLETADPMTGEIGVTLRVRWPHGFTARFTPQLELVDGDGQVVAREGDRLTRVGGSSGSDDRLVIWSFNGRSYNCY